MDYQEAVSLLDGKPIKATLRLKCGAVTLKAKGTFVTDLDNAESVARAIVGTEEVAFIGKPSKDADKGQAQNASFPGQAVARLACSHLGFALPTSNGRKPRGRNRREESPSNGTQEVAPAGETV